MDPSTYIKFSDEDSVAQPFAPFSLSSMTFSDLKFSHREFHNCGASRWPPSKLMETITKWRIVQSKRFVKICKKSTSNKVLFGMWADIRVVHVLYPHPYTPHTNDNGFWRVLLKCWITSTVPIMYKRAIFLRRNLIEWHWRNKMEYSMWNSETLLNDMYE